MIQATELHQLTFDTSDERTANLAIMLHSMNELLSQGLITDESYVNLHNILRENIETENFLSVVRYLDKREDSNEYHIVVAEFPEKADGTIRVMAEDLNNKNTFYLLTNEEAEEHKNKTDKKEKINHDKN